MRVSFYFHPIFWLLWLLAHLPAVFLRVLARMLAFFAWQGGSEMRRVTELNLAYCFADKSPAEIQTMARESLLESARTAIETPKLLFQSAVKSLQQIETVQGKDIVDSLQRQGHGVVIIAPHLGNWEYLGLYLGAHYDCVSLYKPSKYAVVNAVVRMGRTRSGASLMPTDKKGVMAVLKKLKEGCVSGILPDQVPEEANSRVMANFMGHPAPTMTLVSSLLKKPNIKAVAAFAKRLPNGKFALIFQAVDEAIYSADTEVSATALNLAVENLLSEAPLQYQWEYKRFKYDAAGGKNPLYKKRPT